MNPGTLGEREGRVDALLEEGTFEDHHQGVEMLGLLLDRRCCFKPNKGDCLVACQFIKAFADSHLALFLHDSSDHLQRERLKFKW